MWQDIKAFYAASWAFALALPLLFLIPVLAEFAQHIVEIQIGMYDSRAAARAIAEDESRLGFGLVKTLALLLPGYWFVRYMAWGKRAAARFEQPAIGLWLILFAINGAVQAFTLFGPSLGSLLGLAGQAATIATIAIGAVTSILGIYLTAWFIAWPLGNTACGPWQSVRLMIGSFWRTLGYMVAGVLPLMVLHYALGLGAIGLPPAAYWPMLTIDAVVVGFLALTMAGSSFVAARHAAARKGFALIPGRADVSVGQD